MTNTLFESLSHSDFLRLVLVAYLRQGYDAVQSSLSGADAVLISKSGERIGILCKKYRGAFIGRPVLQQFSETMQKLGCRKGLLVATTDCPPDVYAFAQERGIDLYTQDRTIGLLRNAFGDEFIRSGRMPELGAKAKTISPTVSSAVSVASYEKVPVAGQTKVQAVVKPQMQKPTPEPEAVPAQALEPVQEPEAVQARPAASEPEEIAVPVQASKSTAAQEEAPGLLKENTSEERLEDVQAVQRAGSPEDGAQSGTTENTTTVACAECNLQLRVPIDQGMITVTCTECGLRWLFQPEMIGNTVVKASPEVKTTAVIPCQSCFQQLNVPTNRGRLHVRCPKCGTKWLYTP